MSHSSAHKNNKKHKTHKSAIKAIWVLSHAPRAQNEFLCSLCANKYGFLEAWRKLSGVRFLEASFQGYLLEKLFFGNFEPSDKEFIRR